MRSASISQAKNRLSAYLDMVRRGESIVITDRGKPVARLAPLEPGSKESDTGRLAELVRLGIVRLAQKPPLKKLAPPIKLPPGASVLDALLEERRQGR